MRDCWLPHKSLLCRTECANVSLPLLHSVLTLAFVRGRVLSRAWYLITREKKVLPLRLESGRCNLSKGNMTRLHIRGGIIVARAREGHPYSIIGG